jgi:transcriptional regulator with XRE-family HTH domain
MPSKVARWQVDGPKLAARRIARGLTLEALARRAGVSARTLGRYENVAGIVGQLDQLRDIARVLHVPIERIARPPNAPAHTPPVPAQQDGAPSPFAFSAERVKLLAASQLESIVALERALPPPRRVPGPDGKPVPALTAAKFHNVYSACACYEGERFAMVGKVVKHQGATPAEAQMLGARLGVASRVLLSREITTGVEIKVTVHTKTKSETRLLHRAAEEERETCAIVKVMLAPETAAAEGKGFEFFLSTRPQAWAFVVEAVV